MDRTNVAEPTPNRTGTQFQWYCLKRVTAFTVATCAFLVLAGPAHAWSLFAGDAEKAEFARQNIVGLDTHLATLRRVRNVMFRLGVAGAPLCKDDVKPLYGFEAATYRDFPEPLREVAESSGYRGAPVVLYVAERSPAEAAGVHVGDLVQSVAGRQVNDASSGAAVTEALTNAVGSDPKAVTLKVVRNGKPLDVAVSAVLGCDYELDILPGYAPNAATNGSKFFVLSGLLDFVQGDEELAFVLGHEMGHAAFGHYGKTTVNRTVGKIVDTAIKVALGGVGGVIVGTLRPGEHIGGGINSQNFEREADYLGVYLMARAGYDVERARDIWRRMAAEAPSMIQGGFFASHPNSPERMLLIADTIAEIKSKQREGKPLMPEMKSDNHGSAT